MRTQLEKNREALWEQLEKLGGQKLSHESVVKLGMYRSAYKTLCMLCKHEADQQESHGCWEKSSSGREHDRMGANCPFSYEIALEWTGRMKNEDGTTGPHWTMEQTEQVRQQRGIKCDPLKFFVAMNMMYSDYCKVAEEIKANSMDFYVYMAKAFLNDKDAPLDKLERYYHCIARQ